MQGRLRDVYGARLLVIIRRKPHAERDAAATRKSLARGGQLQSNPELDPLLGEGPARQAEGICLGQRILRKHLATGDRVT